MNYHSSCHPSYGVDPPMASIVRSIFELAAAALHGGVRFARSVVEGPREERCGRACGCGSCHCDVVVDCRPPIYAGCCRCFRE